MHITRQSVFHASVLLAGFLFLSRFLGLIREILLANLFGTGALLDVYRAAFVIPDLMAQILVGGTVSAVLIPFYIDCREARGEEYANRLVSGLLNGGFILLSGTGLVLMVFSSYFAQMIAPGFSYTQHILLSDLLKVIIWYPPLTYAAMILGAVLNIKHHFLAPVLSPIVANLIVIGALVLIVSSDHIYNLIIFNLISAFFYLVVLIPAFKITGLHFYQPLSLPWQPGVIAVFKVMLPRVGTIILVQLTTVFSVYWASGLETGSIAALGYGLIMVRLLWSLIAVPLATASLPHLSELYSADDVQAFQVQCQRVLNTTLFFLIPAAAVMFAFRFPIVSILFERGQFTAESVQLTGMIIAMYIFGLIGLGIEEIVLKFFYILKDTTTPLIIALPTSMLHIILIMLWWRDMGATGIALATSITFLCRGLILSIILFSKFQQHTFGGFFSDLMKTILTGVAITLLGMSGWHFTTQLGMANFWIGRVMIVTLLSGVLFFLYFYTNGLLKNSNYRFRSYAPYNL